MIHKIVIPHVGVNVTEFRLVEWKGKEREWIEKGSTVLLIETEKTQWEVEAEISGYLHILVEAEKKAEVGKVVGSLAETKEELEEVQKASPKEAVSARVAGQESASQARGLKEKRAFE
jgi:pyruvate/2-oxoglutarate dehydrogenase complex dihydrolipoamide acyltransferase (E2) component